MASGRTGQSATEQPATIGVRFVYSTGIVREIFRHVRLVGSWDDNGAFSATWCGAPVEMAMQRLEDGCVSYVADMQLDPVGAGTAFSWGVRLDSPLGPDLWGIPTEVNDPSTTDRHRAFVLTAGGGEQRYYLNHSRRLGAQKRAAANGGQPSIEFAVWAPRAEHVDTVVGVFDRVLGTGNSGYIADDGTGIDATVGGVFPMAKDSDGVWYTAIPADQAAFADWDHRPYMFRVTRDDGSVRYRTDLFSRCQIGKGTTDPKGAVCHGSYRDLDGTKSCSVVIDPDTVTREFEELVFPEMHFLPAEEFWKSEFDPSRPVPQRLQDLVIYELHVGSLGYQAPDRDGDFGDVLDFLDYLVDLGVNAVELMPVLQYEGGDVWGYGTSHPCALEFSSGGRDQLKHVIRACHQRGLAVILDVVYNHYIGDAERAEWAYDSVRPDSNLYYWYEGEPGDYPDLPDGTGGYLDNWSTGWAPRLHEELVRAWFISSAVALLEEFHVDGFRVDLSQALYQFNTRHADGHPVPTANSFGAKLLREWTRTMKLIKPSCFLIAEDHSGSPSVTQSPDRGGLGFDATWFSTFYHNLVGDGDYPDYARLLFQAGFGGDEPLALAPFVGALNWSGHNQIVYHKDHDDAGNAKRTARNMVVAVHGAPLIGETRTYAEARCRVVLGLSLLSAGTPMFLMFEEIGSVEPMPYKDFRQYRDDWRAARAGQGARMFKFYQDLIGLRRQHQELRSRSLSTVHVHAANRVLAFLRVDGADRSLVVASFNNTGFPNGYSMPTEGLGDGMWREILNSDAAIYGGRNVGNGGADITSSDSRTELVIPANGLLVLQEQ